VRKQRIGNGPGDRSQRGLVQHDGDALARITAGSEIGDVGFQEAVPAPCIVANGGADFV